MNNINPGRRRRNGSNFFSPSSVLGIRNLAFDQPLARSRNPSRYANASGEPAEFGLAVSINCSPENTICASHGRQPYTGRAKATPQRSSLSGFSG
jgi:hypothetical protein